MRNRFSFLVVVCTALLCGRVTAAPQCNSTEQIDTTVNHTLDHLQSLVKSQLEQSSRIKNIAMEKARAKNWDAARLREEVQLYLSSTEYLELEKERAPYRQQIYAAQALLKTGLQPEKRSQVKWQFCMDSDRLMEAVNASFAINTREIDLGVAFFSPEK